MNENNIENSASINFEKKRQLRLLYFWRIILPFIWNFHPLLSCLPYLEVMKGYLPLQIKTPITCFIILLGQIIFMVYFVLRLGNLVLHPKKGLTKTTQIKDPSKKTLKSCKKKRKKIKMLSQISHFTTSSFSKFYGPEKKKMFCGDE